MNMQVIYTHYYWLPYSTNIIIVKLLTLFIIAPRASKQEDA